MASQTEQKTITLHLLPNISVSKDNQVIKFGKLKKKIKRRIFFFKIMQNMS